MLTSLAVKLIHSRSRAGDRKGGVAVATPPAGKVAMAPP